MVRGEGVESLISNISNSTFDIIINQGTRSQKVMYKIMPDLNQQMTLAVQLYFQDPSSISTSSEYDKLEVIVKE